jgi:monoamine oxidase
MTPSRSIVISALLTLFPQSFAAPAPNACINNRDAQYEWTPVPGDDPINVDIAIVGGGFSGMAAAYQLHQAGMKVVVLEATDVLGGRSRSTQLESGPGLVELGATWINNKTQKTVTALAENFDLELIVQYTEGYEARQMLDGTVQLSGDEEEEAVEDLVS